MIDICAASGCTQPSTVRYPHDMVVSWCGEHDPGRSLLHMPYQLRPELKPLEDRVKTWEERPRLASTSPKERAPIHTQCVWCGVNLTQIDVTREHVVPRSRGGRGGINIAPACLACNTQKADMTAAEFLRFLHP